MAMNWKLSNPAAVELLNALAQDHPPLYLVGGGVRDLLLGLTPQQTDLDVVVTGEALATARRAADRLGWSFYILDKQRDVARLVFAPGSPVPLVCDVAAMRGQSIADDLWLRDFTINAMALAYTPSQTPELIDVTGGQEDLRRGLIRRVTPMSLADDAIRILRAVRLAVQFGFTLETETEAQLRRLVRSVQMAGAERVRDELWKTLATVTPERGLGLLHDLGALPYILPEVAALEDVQQSAPHTFDVLEHSFAAVTAAAALRSWVLDSSPPPGADGNALVAQLRAWQQRLRRHLTAPVAAGHSRADWLIWHTLFHDVGKPQTRTVEVDAHGVTRTRFFGHEDVSATLVERRLEELRFARHEIDLASDVARGHMRPHHLHNSFAGQPISRRAAYRFFRDTSRLRQSDGRHSRVLPAGVDILLVALADVQATHAGAVPDWEDYLAHIAQLLSFIYDTPGVGQPPLVDGHLLMRRLALEPGPLLGELLDEITEAQVAGDIETPEQAMQYAARQLALRQAER
jgi:putative nucleotidyltransferase with HDIG domain